MKRVQPLIAIACTVLLAVPATPQTPQPEKGNGGIHLELQREPGMLSSIRHPYQPQLVPAANLGNSGRLDALLRAGNLYLSLQDAIALALENNLDIEAQRYGPRLAEADLRRAQAGSSIRGVSTSVQSGTSGGGGGGGGGGSSFISSGSSSGSGSGGSGGVSGGSSVPSLDPVFTTNIGWGHRTQPQVNAFIIGTNSQVSESKQYNFSLSKGFLTGARATLGLNNFSTSSNAGRNDFNPYTSSNLNLNITQPLLQGFGLALNNRFIRIAKNNQQVSDLVFNQQVITTVSAVMDLYWQLVSFNEDVKVKRQALALSERLLSDIKKQVEIGTMAPIEIVRAEAEVAARQQDLTISETRLLQQETVLKNALSRTGISSPTIADARIVPTDRIQVPDLEAIEPIQDQMARAMRSRPELAQTEIQLENSRINLKATKNSLLPSVDAYANFTNNALAGQINSIPVPSVGGAPALPRNPNAVDQYFIGGYGTVLGQLLRRNFPDYSVGLQMNIPLRNRAAQADMISAQLNLRQQEIGQQRVVNQIRVDVHNALIGVQQTRAQHQAAVKNRVLQEQTLDAEQKKYALGASTIFFVIQAQRDLAQAQSNEVAALSAYARARVELDRATGQTLAANNIHIQEALSGRVSAPPSQLPVLDRQ